MLAQQPEVSPITEQQLQQLLDLQHALLAIMARDGALQPRLEAACRLFEVAVPGLASSVMRLVAPGRLEFVCAPSVPPPLLRRLDGVCPAADAGSCAHAAWSGAPAYVGNAATDPRWASVQPVATEYGIRSCWSAPVRDHGLQVVGTFALTSFEERLPNSFHRQLMDLGASVVGLLFDQQGEKDQRAEDELQLRRLALVTRQIPNAVAITDRDGRINWINEGMRRLSGCSDDALLGRERRQVLSGELTDSLLLDGMHQAIVDGRDFAATVVNYDHAGRPFTVQLTCTPLVDAGGVCDGSVVMEVDVTARNRLAQFNALLAEVSETVASLGDPVALMQQICEMAVRHAGLELAWIGRPREDGWFEFLAAAGAGIGYVDGLRVSSDPTVPEGNGSSGRTWREGRGYYNRSFADTAFLQPWQERALDYGLVASATLPIRRNGVMWAVMTVYHQQQGLFDADLRVLLEALASSISRGLDRIDLIHRERENQALNQSMLDSATVGVILLHERKVARANQRAATLFGAADTTALLGLNVRTLYVSQEESALIPARIERAFRDRGRAVFEVHIRRLDGGHIWLRIEGAPFEQEGFDQIWSLVDITEQRAAIEGQALMADALASVQEGVVIFDASRRTVYANHAFEELTGYSSDEIRDRNLQTLQGPASDVRTVERLQDCLDAGRPFRGELLTYRKDGSSFWNLLTVTPLRDASGTLTHFVGVQRDISDIRALTARLEYLAFHDDLTDLPNRRSLDRHLSHALAQATEKGTVVALGKIDLDDFKAVNETYGLAAGDQLLSQLRARMQAHIGSRDFLARVGGDEFAVVFSGLDPALALGQLTERLEELGRAFADAVELAADCAMEIVPSMGVALYPRDAAEPGVLMRMAEEALFQAKQHKLHRTSWWSLHGAEATADTHVEHAMDPYGEEAALVLEKSHAHLQTVLDAFIDGFDQQIAEEPYAQVISCLDASEITNLKHVQATHLQLLTGPHASRVELVGASEAIGQAHALVGLDSVYLLRWMAVYRELLGGHFNAQPMTARQRYRLVQLVERRLQDDMQAQLDVQARTLAPYAEMAMQAMPGQGDSWAAVVGQEIAQLAELPGIACALVLRQSPQGVFSIEASGGGAATQVRAIFDAKNDAENDAEPTSIVPPPEDSLLIRAWQTGQVQVRRSLREDLPDGEWSGFAEHLEGHGMRAVVHVPVLDGQGLPVALLILLGRYPNQFSSSVMRQFTRTLQQRWSEIWQRCSRPPPPVPQELAIAYRERLFKDGLRMYMQPVVDLVDGRLVRVEALARLDMGDGCVLPPSEFLPLLRQSELDRLFRLGLDQALDALVEWEAQGLSIDIAVNLPPQTLADPACAQWVFEALASHGVAAHRLTLEMLETQRVEEAERDASVQRLLALGVHLAMDDLGSGYSSLHRLASLPFSTIKVDQDLLKRIRFEPASTISLISAVIQMGRDFGCDVVVEGLEEPGMIEVARLLGARYGQGFGIARPMPAEDLASWNRGFRLAGHGQSLHTCLGALAFQWASIRHRSMHDSALETCPMTAVLQQIQGDTVVAGRLHECVHLDPENSVAADDLLDCLESIVRHREPPSE